MAKAGSGDPARDNGACGIRGTGADQLCDSPAGHYSRFEIGLDPALSTITGTLQSDALYTDPEWEPAAQLRIASEEGGWAGLVFSSRVQSKGDKDSMVALSVALFRGAGPKQMMKISDVSLKQAIPFTITFTGEALAFRIGAEERTVPFQSAGEKRLEFGCSTGDFKLLSLRTHKVAG